jgi:RNA polymerase sigma factor (TIGR02999 family)
MNEAGEITEILGQARRGDQDAFQKLIPIVYEELRRLAAHYMQGERSDHTLQTTALVHEAYLQMVGQKAPDWRDHKHFFVVAAQVMRHILVDYARARKRVKRGGGEAVPLDDAAAILTMGPEELLAINDALEVLARLSPRQSRVVELRCFGGLSVTEIAGVLEVSERTVKSDWQMARAWLYGQMRVRP